MTPEQTKELKPLFDYGSIKPEHKEAAEEIANYISEMGQGMLGDLIKTRFKIQEIPKYDMAESEFVQFCQQAGIYVAGQGYIQQGDGLDAIQFPMIAICEDVRNMQKLVDVIKASVTK
jgi:hypothetical protein